MDVVERFCKSMFICYILHSVFLRFLINLRKMSIDLGYGEGEPSGKGPNQGLIQAKGNEYLVVSYPKLSYFSKVILLNKLINRLPFNTYN